MPCSATTRRVVAAVNRRAVALVEAVRDEALGAGERDWVVLEASVGPRSDAYRPSMTMTDTEAERYHAAQLERSPIRDAGRSAP